MNDGTDSITEYELYEMVEDGLELPFGVSLEVWYVPDGKQWHEHPSYHAHSLVKTDCFLIDWNEVDKPYMIKDEAWWKEKIATMDALYKMMSSVYPVADKIIEEVVEILDPDRESLNEAMQGETYWPDTYTLGHYIWVARDAIGLIQYEWPCMVCGEKVQQNKVKFRENNEDGTSTVLCVDCFKDGWKNE